MSTTPDPALLADAIDRMRSQVYWLRHGTWVTSVKTMAVAHMEAVLAHVEALEKQVHDLNWALGTEGYDKMHDPQDQAEHEDAVRGAERFVENLRAAAEKRVALEADAFALRALVAAGHVSQALVDRARTLPGAPSPEAGG